MFRVYMRDSRVLPDSCFTRRAREPPHHLPVTTPVTSQRESPRTCFAPFSANPRDS
jgi:hypothetical protein